MIVEAEHTAAASVISPNPTGQTAVKSDYIVSPPSSPPPQTNYPQYGNFQPPPPVQQQAPPYQYAAPPNQYVAPPNQYGAQLNVAGTEKAAAVPVIYDMNMPVQGNGPPSPPTKRICGLRKLVFFILLGIAIVVVVGAALGAGLGVALGKKHKKTSSKLPSSGSNSGKVTTPVIGYTTPKYNGGGGYTTPTPTPTPAGSNTDLAFSLPTGYLTLKMSMFTADGAICSELLPYLAATTTVYPELEGNVEDSYTAYYAPSGLTYTATADPPSATQVDPAWVFTYNEAGLVNGCQLSGVDVMELDNTGYAAYVSTVTLGATCPLLGSLGQSCLVGWDGTYE